MVDNSSYVRTLTTNSGVISTSSTYHPLPVVTLLSSAKSSFLDSGSYAWPSATVGSPIATPQSSLPATDAYNVSQHGSSIYFAGASHYLTLTQQPEQYYMTGAFTFETWIYSTSANGYIFGNFNNQTGANSWWIGYNNSAPSIKIFISKEIYGNGAAAKYANTPMPLNQWNHLAIGRDTSSSWFILLNGSSYSLSTSTSGTTYWFDNYSFDAVSMGAAATSPLNINGIATSQGITGYYSDMRFVNGVAIYNTTTNLGPPTQPLTLIGTTQTVLLLNGRPGGIIDSTGKNNLTTVGGAKISQAVFKYGTGSLSFNGTTDYLKLRVNDPTLTFGSGDFTIEAWVYLTSISGTQYLVVGTCDNSTVAGSSFDFYLIGAGGANIYIGATAYQAAAPAPTLNTWCHVAYVRNGTSFKTYLNGVQVGSVTLPAGGVINAGTTNPGAIGANGVGTSPMVGYMDDLRISRIARYTANFTPPTALLSTGTYIQIA